jgi:putative endonuclease
MLKPSRSTRAARGRLAERHGRRAEWIAACWLRLKGFRILARRYRSPTGEIDLLARRGRLLVAVEVKQRRDLGLAGAAITPAQQARTTRTLEHFLQRRPEFAGYAIRYDAVLIGKLGWPQHLPDAWRSNAWPARPNRL